MHCVNCKANWHSHGSSLVEIGNSKVFGMSLIRNFQPSAATERIQSTNAIENFCYEFDIQKTFKMGRYMIYKSAYLNIIRSIFFYATQIQILMNCGFYYFRQFKVLFYEVGTSTSDQIICADSNQKNY